MAENKKDHEEDRRQIQIDLLRLAHEGWVSLSTVRLSEASTVELEIERTRAMHLRRVYREREEQLQMDESIDEWFKSVVAHALWLLDRPIRLEKRWIRKFGRLLG